MLAVVLVVVEIVVNTVLVVQCEMAGDAFPGTLQRRLLSPELPVCLSVYVATCCRPVSQSVAVHGMSHSLVVQAHSRLIAVHIDDTTGTLSVTQDPLLSQLPFVALSHRRRIQIETEQQMQLAVLTRNTFFVYWQKHSVNDHQHSYSNQTILLGSLSYSERSTSSLRNSSRVAL